MNSETQRFINSNSMDLSRERRLEEPLPDPKRAPLVAKYGYPIAGACFYVFVLSPLIMGIYLALSSHNADSSTTHSIGIVNYIRTNVKTPLISDIQIASSATDCKSGYEPMTLGQWPGTETGCYCERHPKNKKRTISSKLCTGELNTNFCHHVHSEPAKDLTSFQGNTFCAKYLEPSADYYYASFCTYGYTSCRPYLCVRDSLSCPLISATYSLNEPDALPANSTFIALNGGAGYLILQSGYSSTPLLDLHVEFNGAPCLSATQHPEKSDRYYYPLLKVTPQGCGKYGIDETAHLLVSYSEEEMYKENGIPVDTKLELYEKYLKGTTAQLYARQRLEMRESSFWNLLNTTAFEEAADDVHQTLSSVKIFSFILILGGGFIAFGLGWRTIVPFKSYSVDKVGRAIGWSSVLVAGGVISYNIFMTLITKKNVDKLQAQFSSLEQYADSNYFTNSLINQGIEEFLTVPEKAVRIYSSVVFCLKVSIFTSIPVVIVPLVEAIREKFILDSIVRKAKKVSYSKL